MKVIKQIIPADGWFAEWDDGTLAALACWAIIETGEDVTHVAGMVQTEAGVIEDVSQCNGFRRFRKYGAQSSEDRTEQEAGPVIDAPPS